jgi:hypothetical protein
MSETISTSTEDIEVLAQAIIDLNNGQIEQVSDSALLYDLSEHVKPYIDRLIALRQGDSLLDYNENGAEDQSKSKKTHKKRKIRRRNPEGPLPELDSLAPQEKAHWIFMERFIPLERNQEILGYQLSEEDAEAYQQALNRMIDNLLVLVPSIDAAQSGDIPALQQIFASTVLFFRNPFLGDDDGHPTPCTIEALRQRFPAYFYKRRKKNPNWFERFPFYTAPLGEARWVLCDIEALNCTLRRPERKLASYARHWGVSDEHATQKTAVEDIYDRIICGEALEENIFAGTYNACTSTHYRNKRRKGPGKLVYTVQKKRKIVINGSDGTPHWKNSKRLWPVAHPSLSFS